MICLSIYNRFVNRNEGNKIMKRLRYIYLLILFLILVSLFFIQFTLHDVEASVYKNGVVVADSDIAVDAGLRILKEGGNAIDAAITVAFVLAVVFPQAGNIGGGGFLVYRQADGNVITINYREKAPLKAYRDMYLDEQGNIREKLSVSGPLAAGIPGTVAGMYLAWKKYGSLPWDMLIQPAIDLAEKGFNINEELANDLSEYAEEFKLYKSSVKIFYDESFKIRKAKSLLIQKDLSNTLKIIEERGADGFYRGEFASKFVSGIQKDGGIFTIEDLATYSPIESEPLSFSYKNYKIYTMGLPSSGGILLDMMMKILERENLSSYKHNSVEYIHLLTEIFKRVYAERAEHLGDANFYQVPINILLSSDFIEGIRSKINRKKPTSSKLISPTVFKDKESNNTTHFSIVDKYGNAV